MVSYLTTFFTLPQRRRANNEKGREISRPFSCWQKFKSLRPRDQRHSTLVIS
jgi:hypothetical protein